MKPDEGATDGMGAVGETSSAATIRCPFCFTLNRVDVGRATERPKCGSCARPILLDRPFQVAGEDLDRLVRESTVPVVVDFYADWCGPCKVMAPVLDDFARDHVGELLLAKLDTDRSPEVSERMGIRGIPTLILFRDGKERVRTTGAVPRERLEDLLREATE